MSSTLPQVPCPPGYVKTPGGGCAPKNTNATGSLGGTLSPAGGLAGAGAPLTPPMPPTPLAPAGPPGLSSPTPPMPPPPVAPPATRGAGLGTVRSSGTPAPCPGGGQPDLGGCCPPQVYDPISMSCRAPKDIPPAPPAPPPPTTGTVPECPDGQHWDASKNTCVSHDPCPPPTIWYGQWGKCIDPTDPLFNTCPPGQHRENADGSGACVPDAAGGGGKGPGDCPPGSGMHWNPNAKECRPGEAGGGGGGNSGGGGGGGGGPAPNPCPLGQHMDAGKCVADDPFEGEILKQIEAILAGKGLPYNRKVIERMKAEALAGTQGALPGQNDAIEQDAVRRGMFRGGQVGEREDAARRAAAGAYGADVNKIRNQKITGNFQAKLDALDRAQKWLDSKRSYLLGLASNDIQRTIGLAQIKLGYAKLQQEKELLQMQLNARGSGVGQDDMLNFLNQLAQYQTQ